MRSLVWFRRDLRVLDNTALATAAKESESVIGLYVITPAQWKLHNDADIKISFWIENLRELSAALAKLNIPLVIEITDSFDDCPALVASVAKKHQCQTVHFNREYEVYEQRRDQLTTEACNVANIDVYSWHDRVIIAPEDISTKDERYYSVFTPYRKVWDTLAVDQANVLPKPKKLAAVDIEPSPVPDSVDGFDFSNARQDLWKAGESEAADRLENFSERIGGYNDWRDIPSTAGTSLLSPYLNAGVISPRQCLRMALDANGGTIAGNEGITTWISELAWRDFYTHVLYGFPRVSRHQPFKAKTNGVPWRDDESDFQAWCDGQTGYPIVDAAMRQLNQTGWMHNRLRMVAAMFLTKNLLIDWRLGERYFMQKLIDGDLAANNGGWQWSASTGTDAVPYFRIFNPFSQSKRFDLEGKFIKKFCPELEPVPSPALHDEKKLSAAIEKHNCDYPNYVVEYKAGRERALAAFKSLS
jgi:deoxyribodipyrimidine photo-lyase